MSLSNEEKRQQEALDHWINYSDKTQEIASRYYRDFAFFLMFFKKRIFAEGFEKYRDMSDREVEAAVQAVKERNEELRKPGPDGSYKIPMMDENNERDLIYMIKAFAELSADDRTTIMSIRSFLDR